MGSFNPMAAMLHEDTLIVTELLYSTGICIIFYEVSVIFESSYL